MAELVVRLVFSLAVVLGLLLVLAKLARKKLHGANGAMIKVLARQPLTRTSAVAVISVADRVLVVGTTEHEVRLLTELDPLVLDLEDDPPRITSSSPEPRDAQSFGSENGALTGSFLGGSILSTQTWKQAFAAATHARATKDS
jgi:flagellar protein FliO/FliZ